jgi:hypothetical protein
LDKEREPVPRRDVASEGRQGPARPIEVRALGQEDEDVDVAVGGIVAARPRAVQDNALDGAAEALSSRGREFAHRPTPRRLAG